MEENKNFPLSGEAEIKNLKFAYSISQIKNKSLAPQGHKYLKVKLFYRSMTYQGTGLYKVSSLQGMDNFYKCCHAMVRAILKANPFLIQALAYEGDTIE